jgi:hypothetical protein
MGGGKRLVLTSDMDCEVEFFVSGLLSGSLKSVARLELTDLALPSGVTYDYSGMALCPDLATPSVA